jgi:lipid II:glycine glycyltransferase (peptidoglycan interpeptide bridge formation enzyme)
MTTKEYAFNQGYTKQELEAAWENAKNKGNAIVNNLSAHGYTWEKLNRICLDQLIQRYATSNKGEKKDERQ